MKILITGGTSGIGRALAVERFSAERIVPKYEAYYERILAHAPE